MCDAGDASRRTRAAARGRQPRSAWSGGRRRYRGSCRSVATGPTDALARRPCCPAGDLARAIDESTMTSGCAWRFSHQAGSASPQPIHGHGDEVRAVFEVADDHRPGSARSSPDGVHAHGAPTAGLRSPQTEPTTGPAVQAAMGEPKRPDEPARRESYLLGFRVRHVSDLGAVGLGGLVEGDQIAIASQQQYRVGGGARRAEPVGDEGAAGSGEPANSPPSP